MTRKCDITSRAYRREPRLGEAMLSSESSSYPALMDDRHCFHTLFTRAIDVTGDHTLPRFTYPAERRTGLPDRLALRITYWLTRLISSTCGLV